MKLKSKALGSLLVATAATAAVAMPSAAQAAQPGDLCRIDPAWSGGAPVFYPNNGYGTFYIIPPNGAFRIVSFDGPQDYMGHGTGQPDGDMQRVYVLQSSCHP